MSNKDLISIIVPVYKVEKYIGKCLESIICQTYRYIEIIVVIDGSPDNSLSICNQYASMDSRIKIINKENGGLASARNAGIEVSKGSFISCVDSDDWIDKDMIESLYNDILKYDADMSVCNFYLERGSNSKIKKTRGPNIELLDKEYAIKYALLPEKYYGFSWNKMYKRSLIGEQRFNEKILKGEDSPFTCQYILKTKKVVYNKIPKYHYRIDTMSITRCAFNTKKLTVLDSYFSIITLLEKKECSRKIINISKVQYANQLLSLLTNASLTDRKKYCIEISQFLENMNEYKDLYLRSNYIDFTHKFFFKLAINNYNIFYLLINIFKKFK